MNNDDYDDDGLNAFRGFLYAAPVGLLAWAIVLWWLFGGSYGG